MTTTQPARAGGATHPFAAAVAGRDLDAVMANLAPEPVLYSAITSTRFEGREVLRDLYASVIEAFDEVRVVDELQNDDTYAFFWEGRIDGRFVAGVDRLRFDSDGRVREITIMGRPLAGLSTFITGIGHRFARRRRGPAVAALLRLSARPLGPMLSLIDPLTRWTIGGGRGRGPS